jgi:MFS family permease
MVPGPEKVTFVETLAGIFHMPYIIGCFIISVLIGPPGAILVAYVTTGFHIEPAILMTITFIGGVGTPYWIGVAILVLTWLLLFFVFYMTGFMRHRLIAAEKGMCPILPEREKTFHETFQFVFRQWPPIVIAVLIIAFYFISSSDYLIASFSGYAVNIVTAIYLAIVYPLWFIVCCTFVWIYFGSIYGLYKLGQQSLRLKPSTEDRMLGVRPFGDLSLSLSMVYFSAMVILIVTGIASTIGSPIIGFVAFLTLLMIFFIVGVVLFISPLYAVHTKMIEQKEIERSRLLGQVNKGVEGETEPSTLDAMANMQRKLDSLTSLMTLERAEKNLNSVPDWPIDTTIMNRFVTIILSTIAIILANLTLRLLT